MDNDKEKMDNDEKFTKNKALKKMIQETHDKEYKEVRKHLKDNEYAKDITMFNNTDINKRMLDKVNIDYINNVNIKK